jgi:malonyl CoA-acyl carrier protein transacylase
MGKDLYENSSIAKNMFDQANEILGFDIQKIMFEGTDEELKEIMEEADKDGDIISFGDRNVYPIGCVKEIIYL